MLKPLWARGGARRVRRRYRDGRLRSKACGRIIEHGPRGDQESRNTDEWPEWDAWGSQ
jgi:hypothetical protein